MSDALPSFPVDVDRLFNPISAEQPAGESLRYEGTYDAIKEARHADDPSLPQGIYERELDTADWEAVERLGMNALETKSKDLQIAAWLLEAWIHQYGLRGGEGGLDLLCGLVEGFWDDLYPPIEEGDLDFRLGPIQWMNDSLPLTLKEIAVTNPDVSGEAQAYSLLDWETAATDAENADDATTRNDVMTSATLTPTGFYRELVAVAEDTLDTSQRLEKLLAERCGDEILGLGDWKDAVRDIRSFGRRVLSEREPAEAEADDADADAGDGRPEWMPSDAGEASVEAGSVRIRSRADAYRLLWEASEYLLRHEPHSPAPYLVKRAVSWGNMSLDELLSEIVKSDSDLSQIYELLGMGDASGDDDG